MEPLSRRQAFGVLTAGAALAALPGRSDAAAAPSSALRPALEIERDPAVLPAIDAVARASAEALALPAMAAPRLARVTRARSWDASVYLVVDDRTRGFVALSPAAFAIATACQAAGRAVAVRTWGHDAAANGGAGRFEGAICAVELADLPGHEPSFTC